jgi:Xaa-Pro dipeptidase
VEEPDCYGLMETDTGKAVLFMPRYDEDKQMWQYVPTLDEMKNKWQLDEVLYVDELEHYLQTKSPVKLICLNCAVSHLFLRRSELR